MLLALLCVSLSDHRRVFLETWLLSSNHLRTSADSGTGLVNPDMNRKNDMIERKKLKKLVLWLAVYHIRQMTLHISSVRKFFSHNEVAIIDLIFNSWAWMIFSCDHKFIVHIQKLKPCCTIWVQFTLEFSYLHWFLSNLIFFLKVPELFYILLSGHYKLLLGLNVSFPCVLYYLFLYLEYRLPVIILLLYGVALF